MEAGYTQPAAGDVASGPKKKEKEDSKGNSRGPKKKIAISSPM